jgi:hypothetical protein
VAARIPEVELELELPPLPAAFSVAATPATLLRALSSVMPANYRYACVLASAATPHYKPEGRSL